MKTVKDSEVVTHRFGPVYDVNSKILILGSFPSVKSREEGFYYMHPQNRFWKCLSAVYGCEIGPSKEEKTEFLHKNHIALWDVVKKCRISGSQDAKLVPLEFNDIKWLIDNTQVKKIYTNGKLADKKYQEFIYGETGISSVYLPSTSAANARFSLAQLLAKWDNIRQ